MWFFGKKSAMKLVVFLGNPGAKYVKTRHNVAWLFAEWLFEKESYEPMVEVKKFFGEAVSIQHVSEKVWFLKPNTFMNLSGKAVAALASFYKIDPKNVLVIHDDKDMVFGKVRSREQGSTGGHNGIKSIIAGLGTQNFPRIKIGVDSAERMTKFKNTSDFVLANFSGDELIQLDSEIFCEVQEKFKEFLEDSQSKSSATSA
jgi:PTH1 family peptidyl-tRNA hydrolase